MAGSTLNPPGEQAPGIGLGHGTAALGPSDSSDSGSDTVGAKRYPFDQDDPLDAHALVQGPDELASDTDRYGSGERASADGDGNLEPNADILPDRLGEEAEDLPDDTLDETLDDPSDLDDPAAAGDDDL